MSRSSTVEYRAWVRMKKRCYYPKDDSYAYYMQKGITVCPQWLDTFDNFFRDMGDCPKECNSLDRYPDRNGNYEPGNCRWATSKDQNNNLSSNLRFEWKGEVLTLQQICDKEKSGISYWTIRERLKRGWSIEKAVTLPLLRNKRQPQQAPRI